MDFTLKALPVIALVVLAMAATSAMGNQASQLERGTRLCIERPGENGSLNVVPVTIRLDTGEELTILGEDRICIERDLSDDIRQTISLRFPFPYIGPNQMPRYWENAPVSITVKRNATTLVMLCPRSQDRNNQKWVETGWHRMWVISPPEMRKACGPEYAN